jgi:hypothetical protein
MFLGATGDRLRAGSLKQFDFVPNRNVYSEGHSMANRIITIIIKKEDNNVNVNDFKIGSWSNNSNIFPAVSPRVLDGPGRMGRSDFLSIQ